MPRQQLAHSVSSRIADTPPMLEKVWQLRTERYRGRFPVGAEWWNDADLDRRGVVFGFELNGELVASARVLPVGQHGEGSELISLRPIPAWILSQPNVWELGRLVTRDRRVRAHLLLAQALAWAEGRLPIEAIISYCTERHATAFAQLGVAKVDGPYAISGRGGDYYTVYAPLERIKERMARLPIDPIPNEES